MTQNPHPGQDSWTTAPQSAPASPYAPPSSADAYGVPASGGDWGGGAPASSRSQDVGFLRAMFDFRFQHYITVRFSAVLYVLAWIVAVLMWGGSILNGLWMGFALGDLSGGYGPEFAPLPLILAIILGWIPSVIAIILFRLGLEFSVAVVRTAQNTGDLVDQGAERTSA